MKLSARNIFSGTIREVRKGQTTTIVKVEVAPGMVITSSITNDAAEDLKLKVGDKASAIIKSSDVLIGV